MHYVNRMQILYGCACLVEELKRLILAERFVLENMREQIAILCISKDDIDQRTLLETVVERDDILMG